MSFSIILPTLNVKGHILELIKEISNIFQNKKLQYEIIVVDDSSTDGTLEIVEEYKRNNSYLNLISRKNLKRNLANSINQGIEISKNDFIIWMDADFQHPPKYILDFIEYAKNYDAVICSRFLTNSERYFNSNNSRKENNENQSYFFNKLCKFFLYKDFTDYTSGFICLRKEIFKNYSLKGFYGDYFVSLIVYLKKKNKKILEIPFKDELRASGLSKTMVSLNLRYLYTCLRYLITLITCMIKKI